MIATALAIARRLPWRYIGLAIVVVSALGIAFDTGRDNMRAKLQPRIDLLTRERDTARANVATLKAAVARHTRDAKIAAGKTKAAQDMAADAVMMAQERGRALAGMKAPLADASRAVPAEAGCAVPDVARKAWGKL